MQPPSPRAPAHVRVLIVGGGFAGIGLGIRLRQEGWHDFVVLERADDIGGTWRDNVYPSCACDVRSHLYSFSFAPNPDWTRRYSPQREIWEYTRRIASEHGVLPHVRLGCVVRDAAWDDAAQRWEVRGAQGTWTADVLVLATGALSDPVVPDLPGLDRFAGPAFHSARWDHGVDLAGTRVAVVGTGASAVQFVPAIQPTVGALHVYQRTPPWVLPRDDRAIGPALRTLYRRVPLAQRLVRGWIYSSREAAVTLFRHPRLARLAERSARRHLARSVADPALRARLTPAYAIGCKRVLLSDDYLPTLGRPNVEVVTAGIRELRPHAIVDRDGVERATDVVIFGTGFRPTDQPIAAHVRGRDGRTLAETWAGSPRAYVGTTVAGFPNLFVLPGPNTGIGHTSVLYMLEAQFAHVLGALRHMDAHDVGALAPRAEAQAAWVRGVDARMRGTVWVAGGCRSWYLDRTGRNSALWPDMTWQYRGRVRRFDPAAYELAPRRAAPTKAATPPGAPHGARATPAVDAAR